MDKLHVVKFGGGLLTDDKSLTTALSSFHKLEGLKLLVHGGGSQATELCERLGVPTKMHDGRRITDDDALDAAIMVYAGLNNKRIVAKLQAMGSNAIGLSGADANLIRAEKRIVKDIDYGWAGDIEEINTSKLTSLLAMDLSLVFCAITHDKKGQLLNTNADTIAASLAVALANDFDVNLHYCFGHNGVLSDLSDQNSVINWIRSTEVETLHKEGIIADGMLPKLHNCFVALGQGVTLVTIGKPETVHDEHALKTKLTR